MENHVELFVSIRVKIQITYFYICFESLEDSDSIDSVRTRIESPKALFAQTYHKQMIGTLFSDRTQGTIEADVIKIKS